MNRDSFEEMLHQRLMAVLSDDTPLVYNDEGIALLTQASLEVWNEMAPVDQQQLVDASHKFVIECLR